jgi:hypothetical protein
MERLRRTLSEDYQAAQYREQLWRNDSASLSVVGSSLTL